MILLAILIAGAVLRWTGVAWDQGHHLHPDERYISMVEDNLEFPKSIRGYFDSATSPLNPYNRQHDSFVYGTLPMVLTKAIGDAIGRKGYDGAYLVGRALSGLFDLVSVWLVYRIGRRLGGRKAGLTAAALIAFCPLGIQLSHFWGVDSFLTTFAAATLLGCVRIAQGRASWKGLIVTGVAAGLAVACKVTALALLAPLGIAILLDASGGKSRGWPPHRGRAIRRVVARSAAAAAAAFVAIRVALPYAFMGWLLDPRYVKDMQNLMSLSKSVAGFPPALQWAGRTVFFPFENFVLWGAAPFFGLAALAGFVAAAVTGWRRGRRAVLPLLAFAAIICAYHALTLSKSIRYFYSAYPVFAVVAGLWLAGLAARKPASRLLRALPAIVVAGTVLSGVAFSAIYRHPVTRDTASLWIFQHVPPGARFAGESWDDGLPFGMPNYNAEAYKGPALELWGPDNPAKVDAIVKALVNCEWIMVTSNRVYGNITRLPAVFPMTTAYYRALFEDRLGFERAADFTAYPSLGPIRIPDDRSEEAFTVYDHPRVLLFRKTPGFSESRVRSILLASMPAVPPTIWDWEKAPRSQRKVARSLVPARRLDAERVGTPRLEARPAAGSWGAAILFYLATAFIGLLALPFVTVAFGRMRDRGAGFARVVGLIVSTYALTILVQGRVIGNGRGAAIAGLCVLALISGAALLWRHRPILAFWRENRRLLIENELAFLAGFAIFAGLRALNPEIYWGEKPMDFSILNILVRTPTLPASDPWFAGAPLGYYTFGHEMIALLTLLTGISTRYTFNLAIGLLGGATVAGAYSLARNWAGSRRAGVACAAFVALLGNLAGLREWLVNQPARGQARHLDWHYFWATSRVIRDTINEFPFWSLTFADLHAHVLAMPLLLLVVAQGLQLVRSHADRMALPRTRLLAAALLGLFMAIEVLTNAWDAPLMVGLLALIVVVTALPDGAPTVVSIRRAAAGLLVASVASLVAALPLWARVGGPPAWGKNLERGASGPDVLTVFGLFFFLAMAWWLAAAIGGRPGGGRAAAITALLAVLLGLAFVSADLFCLAGVLLFLYSAVAFAEDPSDRLACGLIATGFFLVLFAQRLYIYDRMNTFFKLYFEAWLLLAVAGAVLVFRAVDRRGGFSRWPLPVKAAFALLLAGSLFTTVTVARGAVDRARPTYREKEKLPTLDGLRYLETIDPGEYRAVMWLRGFLRGTPVVLEAQGPSYQDFGRVSMLTGLPTVLGWEYHVQQRGYPPGEIAARKAAVETIYSHPGADAVERLLRRYHVGYVYIGRLERKTYPQAGLTKFGLARDLFHLVYENPEVRIYSVVGGDSEDVIAPQREEIPPAETGEAEATEPEAPPVISDKPAEGVSVFGNLKEPRDAAIDEKGRLWVADFGHSRLRIFDAEGGYLGGWGGRGSGKYQLREPGGIAIRGEDVYIADTWNGRVESFTLAGIWKATARDLYGPRGVAAAADGSVWVSDTGNHRIALYDRDLGNPRMLGKKGSGPLEFSSPVGIASGPSGSIYVCDTGNRRIQELDRTGRFVRSIPVPGWNGPAEPHIAADADGTLYVTDPVSNILFSFEPSGRLLRRWDRDDAGKTFAAPAGVALDAKAHRLYVVNSRDNSVARIDLSRARVP